MRAQLGPNRVGWVEDEVLDWLQKRLDRREKPDRHSRIRSRVAGVARLASRFRPTGDIRSVDDVTSVAQQKMKLLQTISCV